MTRPVEVSWFAALCDDDYAQLGVVDPDLRSSWEHCSSIVHTAEAGGFDNILLPSGYDLGIDTVSFAAAIAPDVTRMRLLVAVRCGEMWVPQLARQLASIDAMLGGRLTVNIISSDMPGESLDSPARYRRTAETMVALRTLLSGRRLDLDGEFISLHIDPPALLRGERTPPPFYFGGLSEEARDVAAEHADVYLMWPDTEDHIADLITDMRRRAALHGRTLKFGYRAHVVVRDTDTDARAAAEHLVAALDDDLGAAIRARSLDSASTGVRRQAELRDSASDDGYVEPHLWTGIGRARSGCGAAIVGTPRQVADKLVRYRDMGIEAFILSGYPHRDEAHRVADTVLPLIEHSALR
ncbi:MAG: LLM class flavin-dependent oxidoreductase [Actinomycetota bacterium]